MGNTKYSRWWSVFMSIIVLTLDFFVVFAFKDVQFTPLYILLRYAILAGLLVVLTTIVLGVMVVLLIHDVWWSASQEARLALTQQTPQYHKE